MSNEQLERVVNAMARRLTEHFHINMDVYTWGATIGHGSLEGVIFTSRHTGYSIIIEEITTSFYSNGNLAYLHWDVLRFADPE